ncbi:MAG: DUF1819 family protein [Methanobrevibacter sp.]|jgi:hypothetical protein|nr:DUF1819 family protein [Candidatus Methanoflexus mossambicus]
MKYSSGLTKKPFLYLETKKTAKYILSDFKREDIIKIAIEKNIYQVENENRSKVIGNACVSRLNSLPRIIIEDIINTDINTSKILVLIAIMKTDRLFFEFMHEIFRNKIILGDLTLNDKDLNIFFDDKALQSETIANWEESTIKRLKKDFIRLLRNAGVISDNTKFHEIIVPLIDLNVEKDLINNDLSSFLYGVTGKK